MNRFASRRRPALPLLAGALALGSAPLAVPAHATVRAHATVPAHAAVPVGPPPPGSDSNAAGSPETTPVDVSLPTRARAEAEPSLGPGVSDPRKRQPPRTHRFRMAIQLDHIRLSAAVNQDDGSTQRFHYLPLQLDFAYQVQLFKVLMLRPSVALGANPANTLEAMPAVVHPQIFGGYQGKAFGVALGYGYLHPFPVTKDIISNTRGGLGQPVITANHAVRGELSYTTRVDRGALSFGLRLGGVKSHIRHYADLDERSWRFIWGAQLGWYFGDGYKSQQRQRERQRRRRDRSR